MKKNNVWAQNPKHQNFNWHTYTHALTNSSYQFILQPDLINSNTPVVCRTNTEWISNQSKKKLLVKTITIAMFLGTQFQKHMKWLYHNHHHYNFNFAIPSNMRNFVLISCIILDAVRFVFSVWNLFILFWRKRQ